MEGKITVGDILNILDSYENYRIIADDGYLFISRSTTKCVEEDVLKAKVDSLQISPEYDLDIFIGKEGDNNEN